ncbi:MAG: hypothetical protein K2X68_05445 [Novosphingobium sp.]|nr:hypothetical protein [Novosphingobium sp.]
MSDDDNLTFWLKTFLGFWFGGAIGMAGVHWMLGKTFTEQEIALRAVLLTVGSAILALLRLAKRAS